MQSSANAANDVGVDFDVFLDAQDIDVVSNVTTTFTPDGDGKGTVDITFTAFGKPKTVHYAMVKTGQGLEDRQHFVGRRSRRSPPDACRPQGRRRR